MARIWSPEHKVVPERQLWHAERAALVEQQRAHTDALAGHTELYATALAAGEMSWEQQSVLFASLRQRAVALDSERL